MAASVSPLRLSFCMHWQHEWLDEGQPSVTEPIQDRGYVVGHQSAAGQDHHRKFAAAINCRNNVDSLCNLCVIIDCQLSLDAHVAALCFSGYYQLQQLCPVAQSLSNDTAKTLVHAFVSSRCCNALLYGVSEGLLHHVQSVLTCNWCAVLWCDHITPILQQLHWLPMQQRVQFKFAVLVFQCLSSNIWQTTVSSALTLACADSARPTQRCVLFNYHTTPSVIGVLHG